MATVISVMNYKGGVGKTTLTANLSAGLAELGYRVLMIDLDPQSSLTFSFVTPDDWKEHLSEGKTIKNWFTFDTSIKKDSFDNLTVLPQNVYDILNNQNCHGILNLIASHLDLINVDLELATELTGVTRKQQSSSYLKVHNILKEGIKTVSDKYDYIVIDCPPNFNIVTQNAIIASEHIIVPAKPDYLSTLGIVYLKRNLSELIKDYNFFSSEGLQGAIAPSILGVVFTMVQIYNNLPISIQRQYIHEVWSNNIPTFRSYMRDNKSIFADAPQYLIPVILEQGVRTDIKNELQDIVSELLNKINGK